MTGLVDFESVRLADPLFDVAWWAWADGGVRSVHVHADDTGTWQPAELEPPRGREWQRFSIPWTPKQGGAMIVA